jgi:hypothetical protein
MSSSFCWPNLLHETHGRTTQAFSPTMLDNGPQNQPLIAVESQIRMRRRSGANRFLIE